MAVEENWVVSCCEYAQVADLNLVRQFGGEGISESDVLDCKIGSIEQSKVCIVLGIADSCATVTTVCILNRVILRRRLMMHRFAS